MKINNPNLYQATKRALRRWLGIATLCAMGFLSGCAESVSDTVRFLNTPSGPGSAEPHLARSEDGTVVLSWLEPDKQDIALRYARLSAGTWLPPQTVALGNDKDWFVNWADFPSVNPIKGDLWAAHWLAKRPGGTYSYDVVVALSQDGGLSWGTPITPHTDGTRTEHGFVSLFPWQSGIGAVWLDGRNMEEEGGHGSAHAGGMTLRSAVITPAGEITDDFLVDELVCDCCQTDIALAAEGPVVVYRNRTSREIRDIYIARTVDGRWQPGQPVAEDGWEISGCPVNGPAIAALGHEVVVAWYTAADDHSRIRLARSADGGASFTLPIDLDIETALGRVDVALLQNGSAAVSWLRKSDNERGALAVRTVSASGELGVVHTIAELQTTRTTGFPQMLHVGDELLFAWTESNGDTSTIRSATVDIHTL